jgi:hypothetical protein
MPKTKAITAILTVFAISMIVYWVSYHDSLTPAVVLNQRDNINQDVQDRVKEIQREERQQIETLWADEYLAQRLGRSIERWWDSINASSPKLRALGDIGKDTSVLMSQWVAYATIQHLNIERFRSDRNQISFSSADWKSFIEKSIQDGWMLENIEFRHIKFDRSNAKASHTSEFFFRAGISNAKNAQRCLVTGPLKIRWNINGLPEDDMDIIAHIDTHLLEVTSTNAAQPFQLIHQETIHPPENADAIDPLLVHDIDGDGVSEIVLANKNKLLRYHHRWTLHIVSPLHLSSWP